MATIEVIMGCMFSGKSTELIRRMSQYEVIGKETLLINHSNDIRCNDEVQTHNLVRKRATKTRKLMDLSLKESIEVIGIDEAQFFDDLEEFVRYCENFPSLTIIIAGLDGDFKREKFGQIINIIPLADKVEKLSAMCSICKDGTKASFSKRQKEKDNTQVKVGAAETYIAVCRKCYLNPSIDFRSQNILV